MKNIKIWKFFVFFLAILPHTARADSFEIFDGQVYNGKYYPRIDIIEWNDNPGDPSHMEFHIYSKGKPIDLSFLLEQKDRKKVMLVNYFIKERGEHLYRRVLAPGHFTDGFNVYRDNTDPDFDNILVSMEKMPAKPGRTLIENNKYASCEEPKVDSVRLPANQDAASAQPTPVAKPGQPNDQVRPHSDPGAIKKNGVAVPFGDL